MATTTTPLTDKITSLLSSANSKTGASDTTLASAVTRLINGYGSGGSSSTTYKTGTFTLSSDVVTNGTTALVTVAHGLGKKPDFFIVTSDMMEMSVTELTALGYTTKTIMSACWVSSQGAPVYGTNKGTAGNGNFMYGYLPANSTGGNVTYTNPTSLSYLPSTPDTTNFYLSGFASAMYYRSGHTYTWCAGYFS